MGSEHFTGTEYKLCVNKINKNIICHDNEHATKLMNHDGYIDIWDSKGNHIHTLTLPKIEYENEPPSLSLTGRMSRLFEIYRRNLQSDNNIVSFIFQVAVGKSIICILVFCSLSFYIIIYN